MTYHNTRRGFTLIELLVVVLIIGILAAVALPQYQKAVIKTRYASLKDLAFSLKQAEELYYLTNGNYTTNFADLDVQMPGNQKDGSTESLYEYDWGLCNVEKSLVECYNFNTNMGIQFHFFHTSKPNVRTCVISGTTDLTDIRNTICKAETGAEQGTVMNTYNAIAWTYE